MDNPTSNKIFSTMVVRCKQCNNKSVKALVTVFDDGHTEVSCPSYRGNHSCGYEIQPRPAEYSLRTTPIWGKIVMVLSALVVIVGGLELSYILGVPDVNSLLLELSIAALSIIISVPLHEGLHGLFFKIFSGKVQFGHTWNSGLGPAFWASSPVGMPRWKFQIAGLAPQVLLVLTPLLILSMPVVLTRLLLNIVVLNLAGGCADIYFVIWVSRFPSNTLVEDTKTGVKIHGK